MFSPGWRLVSRQRGCVTLSHCDILAEDHLHIFGCYCSVSVSVYMPPFCSFPCKGMEVGIPCWKVERRPIRHFLRLWPESAKSSGDLIRPFFPCQPGAYKWGLINSAISRLSCSQDCWSIKGIPWWIISLFFKCVSLEPQCKCPSFCSEVARQSSSSAYLIIVTDATDGVSVNFFGRCKFLQI